MVPAVDKGKRLHISFLQKKTAPPSKPKGIVISAPVTSASTISEVLEGVAADVPVERLGEKEQLDVALKASIDTALEKQAPR